MLCAPLNWNRKCVFLRPLASSLTVWPNCTSGGGGWAATSTSFRFSATSSVVLKLAPVFALTSLWLWLPKEDLELQNCPNSLAGLMTQMHNAKPEYGLHWHPFSFLNNYFVSHSSANEDPSWQQACRNRKSVNCEEILCHEARHSWQRVAPSRSLRDPVSGDWPNQFVLLAVWPTKTTCCNT